ncbi:hypothetical protein RH858_13840 [Halalkaliarchaeum sp. AArc-GB]|uniref:hypothetical protein n=1 Tax=Halalkaliarchaeum sp. AArc-GB TaxID=3074078 RepID=UPI00285BE7B1|nr:hypothetical protein [Halalkaliarchaeum sp. AArc-GB]MDR5674212.1 hypothetical protein [Halalkaliarchaeum sp. AArc-GB]
MDKATKQALPVFAVAFCIRIVAAIITTVTNLNPDSTADAVRFENTAALIAQGILKGEPYLLTSGSLKITEFLIPLSSPEIYKLWGTFLAPFWLLPGPSGLYARLGTAFLGAFAIYNVYVLARYYHSHRAGVIATLPMMFYPSIVAVHSTLLREALVLFGITTAARVLLVPSNKRSRLISYVLAGGLLHVALLLRDDNVIVYAAAIATAVTGYAITSGYLSKRTLGIGAALSPIGFVLSLPVIQDGIEFLARTRELRARGRAVYLPDVIPQTVFELAAFSWIGAVYFLYAPFPWMIETMPDLLVGIEGIVSMGFTLAGMWGIRSMIQKNKPVTAGLIVGLVLAVVLYGVGTVNYGTGMRHRQMFLWVIFLFGGIGIAEQIEFKWAFQSENSPDLRSGQISDRE